MKALPWMVALGCAIAAAIALYLGMQQRDQLVQVRAERDKLIDAENVRKEAAEKLAAQRKLQAPITRVMAEGRAVFNQPQRGRGELPILTQLLAGLRKIKTDDCPIDFIKAWENLIFQLNEAVIGVGQKNTHNLLALAGVVFAGETGGASLTMLKQTDLSDPEKNFRAALEQVLQIALNYGVK